MVKTTYSVISRPGLPIYEPTVLASGLSFELAEKVLVAAILAKRIGLTILQEEET